MKKKNEELKNERFSKLSLPLEGEETLKYRCLSTPVRKNLV